MDTQSCGTDPEANSPLPLLCAQAGVWFAQQLDPASPIYNTAEYVEIHGELDVASFRDAVRRTLGEADALGIRLTADPAQVPWAAQPATVDVLDLRAESDPYSRAVDLMWSDVRSPLDPLRDQLIRQTLFQIGQAHFLWFQRFHHILLDGYGFTLITRRVAEVYSSLVTGQPPCANPFRSITETIAAEKEYGGSAAWEADKEFWLKRYPNGTTVPSFTDKSATRSRSFHRSSGTIAPDTRTRLDMAAKQLRTSWPEIMIAATAAYLHRWTGAAEVILGLPLMNRLGSSIARVPCMTVNVLPLRIEIDTESGFDVLARQVSAELRAVGRHQRYRGEQLRRDLRLGANRLVGPEVNIKPFREDVSFGDAQGIVHYLSAGPVNDLTITAYPSSRGDGIALDIDGNSELYSAEQLRLHRLRFVAFLERMLTEYDTPLRRADLLTEAERLAVLAEFNDTTHPVPGVTLPDLTAEQASRTPNATALRARDGAVSYTYSEFDNRVNALAHVLLDSGVQRADIVAVCATRSELLVIALHAVVRIGAAYLPIDPDYPADRIDFMLSDAKPSMLLSTNKDAPAIPGNRQTILLDSINLVAKPNTRPEVRPRSDDPAYLIYTSGSTGRPKGVLIAHNAIVNRLLWMQYQYQLETQDRVLQKTPASFDVSVWEFFWPLLSGSTLVVAMPGGHSDPNYLTKIIRDENISVMHFVPSMLDTFLESSRVSECVSLRKVMCSGEALHESSTATFFEKLPGTELHNLYGPTEAAIDVTYFPCAETGDWGIPIGRPIWNTKLYVLDSELSPVPIGVAGDLYIAGAGLAIGYLNRPELTAQRFVANPFDEAGSRMYRTGDIAAWRTDGNLDFLGRSDHQVKVRGLRIELGEIETAVLAHPDVIGSTVLVREDQQGHRLLTAYIVPGKRIPETNELRAALRKTLPEHMVPTVFVPLDRLPLSPNGKLDRDALPEPDFEVTDIETPADPREQVLCELFAETLDLPELGTKSDFFDHGGHSLRAARLVGRIRDVLGADLTIANIFTAPTPLALAREIDNGAQDTMDILLPLRDKGNKSPLFCVHPAGGLGWSYAPLLRLTDPDQPIYALQSRGIADHHAELPHTMREVAKEYLEHIRSVQPEGPYHLIGWSIGGMIAHEMAALAQANGDKVGLLAQLDAYPSDQWRHLPPPTEADALAAIVRIAGHEDLPAESLDRETVIELLREQGSALANLSSSTLSRIIQIVENNTRLVRDTDHSRYQGDVLFFTATAQRNQEWLHREGWRRYVTGAIENHDIDCTHPGLMQPSNLAAIADIVGNRVC